MNKAIEDEQLYSRNEDGVITEPFNPKDVDIISQPMVIFNIVENLRDEDIILDPDFQRIPDLWESRLIESLIIRIPLLSDPFLPVNVGFGIPYVLPLITELLVSDEKSLLLIENPELHLHPKGQTMIAKLISLELENGCQILCESHSDHVINGVRVAAKQEMIDNEKIGIAFFSKNVNQETKVHMIYVDKRGNLSDYPSGLLDEWGILMTELI